MRAHPDRSLGIATMNGVQRDLIALEMDRLATAHPEVEAYREHWGETLERFFVKNLENVQGDERDVIFISTVFGPTIPGGRVLQRFGPINGASGHRRLNVLFTRAKHHVRLFTSMTPDDVTAGPESPRGAQVLKAYLAYAQTGRLEAGTETHSRRRLSCWGSNAMGPPTIPAGRHATATFCVSRCSRGLAGRSTASGRRTGSATRRDRPRGWFHSSVNIKLEGEMVPLVAPDSDQGGACRRPAPRD